jgi:hypothetical protein
MYNIIYASLLPRKINHSIFVIFVLKVGSFCLVLCVVLSSTVAQFNETGNIQARNGKGIKNFVEIGGQIFDP